MGRAGGNLRPWFPTAAARKIWSKIFWRVLDCFKHALMHKDFGWNCNSTNYQSITKYQSVCLQQNLVMKIAQVRFHSWHLLYQHNFAENRARIRCKKMELLSLTGNCINITNRIFLKRWHRYSQGMYLLPIKTVAKNQNYYASLNHSSPFPSVIE